MKIHEIVSEAPFVKSLKSFPAKATKAIKNIPNQIKNIPGNIQSYLSKDDNLSKMAKDISTIGDGPGLKDYGSGDKASDNLFQDLLNILQDDSLKKKAASPGAAKPTDFLGIDKQKIATAMTNMYQSDKQLPTDRLYFINSIKHLIKTHPDKITVDKIYNEYKPIFKRYQINPNELA